VPIAEKCIASVSFNSKSQDNCELKLIGQHWSMVS